MSGEDVVLLDWQLPVQGPGAYDLAYFLSSTLPPETPLVRETALLRLYHDTLLERGVEDYGFDVLRFDYQRAMLLMVQRMTMSLSGIDPTNDRGRELLETWVDRLQSRARGIDPDALLMQPLNGSQ